MYDWTKKSTQKIYPIGNQQNLITNNSFFFADYDYDGDIEIMIRQELNDDPYQYKENYYLFKNGQLRFEREYISPESKPKTQSYNVGNSEYPMISDVVRQNSSGKIEEVYDLHFKNLYLVKIENDEKHQKEP